MNQGAGYAVIPAREKKRLTVEAALIWSKPFGEVNAVLNRVARIKD